ncbi:alpha-2,8-sialyltransferase 8F-like [Strongylocentrotus purpuratus]|uniref:Uncharacterized protein n=1 Tax=Strongylocentrotus purpuratus TaxID=7668 RepID=A0A7M7HMW7_STRPU|nr:alpha-2,8-sialyltransferase 8F-like [Strongylocentrotus purpuratus]
MVTSQIHTRIHTVPPYLPQWNTRPPALCECFEVEDVSSKLQNTTSQNQTTQKHDTLNHLIPWNDTIKLWKFKDINDHQLYLYENLLKRNWTADLTIMETFRQALAKYRSELGDNAQIILHKGNTKRKQKINFVFHNRVAAIPDTIFEQLPKTNPFPQETRYRSCAVVGNSGIMLNSSCGKDVDKHDYVFRCNLAPLLPFKVDAGMKSNLTTMNPSMVLGRYKALKKTHSIKQYNEDISQYDGMLWNPCFAYEGNGQPTLKAFLSFKGKKPKMVCGNPQHFKSVLNFWQEKELTNKISTGFYLATTAIQLCDEVQLYGFWPFSAHYGDTRSDVPYHYFDDLSAAKADSEHSMNEEFDLLVQLHTLGILRVNAGSCS